MKTILVKLKDENIHRRLRLASADNGMTMQALVEAAIDAGLRPYERLNVVQSGGQPNVD